MYNLKILNRTVEVESLHPKPRPSIPRENISYIAEDPLRAAIRKPAERPESRKRGGSGGGVNSPWGTRAASNLNINCSFISIL